MNISKNQLINLSSFQLKPVLYGCSIFAILFLFFETTLSPYPAFIWTKGTIASPYSDLHLGVRKNKFLEVPQIIWGLNNQKIAFARACLTARLLNRTLLMPSLSASLFYKEVDLLEPLAFDKLYHFEKFNSICSGFVHLGRYSDVSNRAKTFELQKGSGRKWEKERDLDQLKQCREESIDRFEVIRIVGKHPFLWHDHWPVKDYAKIFECLVLIDDIANDVSKVVSKISELGSKAVSKFDAFGKNMHLDDSLNHHVPYVAVHMRIEKDWMIHCKKLEQRLKINEICSSKEEIMETVAHITALKHPIVVYLAVADTLLEDESILSGWEPVLLPVEKKRLGVLDIYNKYPYLIQSAIDFEVCSQADVFVGNSYSTFSSLIALYRTQKLVSTGITSSCERNVAFASYAYNVRWDSGGARRWMTDMSASSFQSISYGTNNVSCHSNWNSTFL